MDYGAPAHVSDQWTKSRKRSRKPSVSFASSDNDGRTSSSGGGWPSFFSSSGGGSRGRREVPDDDDDFSDDDDDDDDDFGEEDRIESPPLKRKKVSESNPPEYLTRTQRSMMGLLRRKKKKKKKRRRRGAEPSEAGPSQAPPRLVRRLIMEEEEQQNAVMEGEGNGEAEEEEEEEEEEEAYGEVPGLLTDDEGENEEQELERIHKRDCLGCRLILGLERGIPRVKRQIVQKIDAIMHTGYKNRDLVTAAKLAEKQFFAHFTKKLNYKRSNKIPKWTWQSIRKHYKENHCDDERITIYERLRIMGCVSDTVRRTEMIYWENTGDVVIDPETGEKGRQLVKRCRVPVAKLVHSMTKDEVAIRMRLNKERDMSDARSAKMGGSSRGQDHGVFSRLEFIRFGPGGGDDSAESSKFDRTNIRRVGRQAGMF